MKYYLAVDIGASSGRLILSSLENGKMTMEEIHRFANGNEKKNGHLTWDVEHLFEEIINGMKKCSDLGKIPVSIGIDTWAVDFVLLDENDEMIGDAVAYRDSRTQGMDEVVYSKIPLDKLYEKTGIQKQIFNSIYQLTAIKEAEPENLEKARSLLMIPDYLNFLLTGVKAQEYTNATTTQLVNTKTRNWDKDLMDELGIPSDIFLPIRQPGEVIGELKKEIQKKIGFNCKVILPATHDTGSAVVAVPCNEKNVCYISSGTWSLMGTELKESDSSGSAMKRNFTNEGGYQNTYRFLKNIMGLWMIQSVKKEIGGDLGFGEICSMASECKIASIVDANDDRFLAPENMTEEVKRACMESGQKVPEGIAEVAAVIYNSLAKCYARTLEELEVQTGVKYNSINIVGGGSNADYLNRLTAKETGISIYAGPAEATAIGNLAVQMIADGELYDLEDARKCVFRSFEIKKY